MTTPTSDDFFSSMGAASPPPRPATKLARPPGASSTTKTATAGSSTFKTAPPPRPAGRTGATPTRPTTPGRGARGSAPLARPASSGRSPTPARGTVSAGRGATGSSTTIAGRSTAGRSTAGRGPRGAGRSRTTAGRSTRPAASATPTAGSTTTAFGTPSTHLSSPAGTTNNTTPASTSNPYAAQPAAQPAASSSDSWFSQPAATPGQNSNPYGTATTATTATSNPYAASSTPAAPSAYGNTNMNQWQQQPSTMQPQQPSTSNTSMNQWQQPSQQQQPENNFFMGGTMSNSGITTGGTNQSTANYDDFENEPPLLEELGINLDHILSKTKAVILPFQRVQGNVIHLDPSVIVEDADLAGPLIFGLALGGELLMTGKLHFGYIYGFGLFGCLAMTLILNLMTPKDAISVWTVTSILGYALLPVNVLAAVKIIIVNIIRLETFGRFLALIAVLWSTIAATRLLEVGCGLRHQRYLIGYPLALLYSAFVLMTIF